MPRLCGMPDARIWLVEDDPIVRKACAQTLTLAGWQVAAFADAESALAAFAAGPPAVVVSDVRLPGVALTDLRDAALSLKAGGVGFYESDNFVHIDTGRVRSWG